jgi:ribonuclease R
VKLLCNERNKEDFVGVIDAQKNFSFVSTMIKGVYRYFIQDRIGDAEQGDVVLFI